MKAGVPRTNRLPSDEYGDLVSTAEARGNTNPSGVLCAECDLEFAEGYRPDPCIGGYLPDVAHACCGHGKPAQAYVSGGPGCRPDQSATTVRGHWLLRGRAAVAYLAAHRSEAVKDPST